MSSGIASGGVSQIPPDSPVIATATVTSATGDTLYTVPAGRKFYCQGASIAFGGPATDLDVYLRIDSTDVVSTLLKENESTVLNGNPLFLAEAGEVVKGRNGATSNTSLMTIWGYIL